MVRSDILGKKLMYERAICEIELSGKKRNKVYTKYLFGKHIYSDKDEGTEIKTLSLNEVFDNFRCGTVSSKLFSRYLRVPVGEKFCEMWIDDEHSIYIHQNNFVSVKIITTYRAETSNRTLEYLMRNLVADEMIEYLKDNGLNACPIVR